LEDAIKIFVEINTNPFAITSIDPGLLFAGGQQLTNLGGWESESTVVQQFVDPYNLGATLGFILMKTLTASRTQPGISILVRSKHWLIFCIF